MIVLRPPATTWSPAGAGHPSAPAAPRSRGGPQRALVRLRVWASALELDRRLAAGAAPAESAALALRARQLRSGRTRAALCSGLTAAVDAAARIGQPTAGAPIMAGRVTDAAGPLVCLARDLRTAPDPPVRVLAEVSLLLSDGAASPLYGRTRPVALRERVLDMRAALAGRCGPRW